MYIQLLAELQAVTSCYRSFSLGGRRWFLILLYLLSGIVLSLWHITIKKAHKCQNMYVFFQRLQKLPLLYNSLNVIILLRSTKLKVTREQFRLSTGSDSISFSRKRSITSFSFACHRPNFRPWPKTQYSLESSKVASLKF